MTSDELFPVSEVSVDSPRLRWIKRERVITYLYDGGCPGPEPSEWFAAFDNDEWTYSSKRDFFAQETAHNGEHRIGQGETEDEAIADLCVKAGIRLWNEEGA